MICQFNYQNRGHLIASGALTSHHEIGASEMGKARSTDAAPIRPVGSITVEMKEERSLRGARMTALRHSRNQIDGHFSFGCFDGCVRLSGGDGISFREDLVETGERFS